VSEAKVLGPGQGTSMPTAGVTLVLKTVAEDTDGRWTLFEYTAPPRFAGPPPHWHKATDEGFFVLEGTIRFTLNGEIRDVSAGGYARVPPGIVHAFSNPIDEPARFLGIIVPGGFEKYWEELGRMMADEPSWPPADLGPVVELMAKYDAFPPPAP
jgi:mannose-6-phosphate isomerase-like protein (cupin superfamily)